MLFAVLNTALSLTTLVVLLWVVSEYIRARREIRKLISLLHTKTPVKKMDDLLEGLTKETTTTPASISSANALAQEVAEQRERLAITAAGGQARPYLGKAWSVKEIDALGDDEVGKLYALYEARLGASITKTLGRAAVQLYTSVVSMFLPIPPENQRPLEEELLSDPFVDHALSSTACELYYRYGKLLAPIIAAVTTTKYCQIGHQCPRRIEEDGLERQQCDSTGGVTHTNAGDTHANAGGAGFEGDGRDDAVIQLVA